METQHKIGLGAIVLVGLITAILLFGPPWVRGPVVTPAEFATVGPPVGQRIAQGVFGSEPAPYVEHRSECELLNSGYGLPFCDSYGPGFAMYRQEIAPRLAGYDGGPDYGVDPYSRGYGIEGRGWQLP
jgi:hypothetical protein